MDLAANIATRLILDLVHDNPLHLSEIVLGSDQQFAVLQCFSAFALLSSLAFAKPDVIADINPTESVILAVEVMASKIGILTLENNDTDLMRLVERLIEHLP